MLAVPINFVHSRSHKLRVAVIASIACLFFFCAGHAFVPLLGLEDDEALFGQAMYHPRAELYSLTIGAFKIPIMLMSYLGALKAWVYTPIFAIFGPSVRSLREPMLLAGVVSIWLFFLLLRRIAGNRAALIGCGLLATDSTYLLTTVFDWGPVALQHLLLLGGVLLLIRFYQTLSSVSLAGGAFLMGLGMWDKALAIWMLSGIFVAGILLYFRQIWAVTTRKRVLILGVFFLLGALPLLHYNISSRGATFRGNVQRDPDGLAGKARFLALSAGGNGLFGWLTFEDWQTKSPHPPQGAIERASAKLSEMTGKPRRHFLLYAFLLAVVIAPFGGWQTVRLVLFGLIALAIAWFQMAINANTGGSVHHTVLLWPLPQLIVAVSFANVSQRLGRAGLALLVALLAPLLVWNILVVNEYYTVARRNGGAPVWSDAGVNLAGYLKGVQAKNVYCMDWGFCDQLRLLSAGRLPVAIGSDQISKPEMTAEDRTMMTAMISESESIFIAHTKEFEVFPDRGPKLIQFAKDAGFEAETLRVIPDNYGRNVYEVYKFRRQVSSQ